MFSCELTLVVNGKGRSVEGRTVVSLPFPPVQGMELHSIHTEEPLIVDVVAWDVMASRFYICCLPIETDRKVRATMAKLAGEWEWDVVECPTEEEPAPPAPPNTDITDKLRKILDDRARGLPRNPRDAEKN